MGERLISLLKKKRRSVSEIKLNGNREQTKKILEEKSKIKTEISILRNLPKLIKQEIETDKTKEGLEIDSLDTKILSEESPEEKGEATIIDNSYGRRGMSGSSLYSGGIGSSYTDYDKIWGFLGQFRTKGMYQFSEFEEKRLKETPLVIPSCPQILCDFEVIQTCVKHQKYFMPGYNMNGTYGNVPMAGVSSRDWEKFKLWAMMDYILYKLFMDTM